MDDQAPFALGKHHARILLLPRVVSGAYHLRSPGLSLGMCVRVCVNIRPD